MLFDGNPSPAHVDRVAEAGFDGIELYGFDANVEAIAERCDERGVAFVYMSGARPPLNRPDRFDDVVANITETIALAERVGCQNLNVKAGRIQDDLDEKRQRENVASVLREVAPVAESADITLVLEPLNLRDHPGHLITSAAEGAELIKAVDSPSVKLLYDFYHEQITSGDVIRSFQNHLDLIGHTHIADTPGRHEPGTGELHYGNIFDAIAEVGYDGYVGCEFSPIGNPDTVMHDVRVLSEP